MNDIITMSATKLAAAIRAKQVSALEAVNAYIDRQIAVNDMLNAVVMNCFERARSEAKALDAKAAKGEWAGALHGVPMTIKDSLDTEGVISTGATMAGSTGTGSIGAATSGAKVSDRGEAAGAAVSTCGAASGCWSSRRRRGSASGPPSRCTGA